MSISENATESKIKKQKRALITNSFYSLLLNYGNYFSMIIVSFILARIISQATWGFLILSESYITIVTLVLDFLPPALNNSLDYYVPLYRASDEKNRLKSMIRNSIMIKVLFVIPVFIISMILFSYFAQLFSFNLKNYIYLLIILAPLIIIYSLEKVFDSIFRAFNKYNVIFYLLIINKIIQIGGLLWLLFNFTEVKIEYIAYIILFMNLIPFLIKTILVFLIYLNIKPTNEKCFTFKENTKMLFNYGKIISLEYISGRATTQVQLQSLGTFEATSMVVGYTLSLQFQNLALYAPDSLVTPMINSFSSLGTNNNHDHIVRIFNISYKFSLILICFAVGVLFFLTDFVLIFFFGDTYIKFSLIMKLILFSAIFTVLKFPFSAYIYGTKKLKYIPYLVITYLLIRLPLFFFGLLLYGIIGAVVFGLIISNVLITLIQIFILIKKLDVRLDMLNISIIHIIFLLSLGIILMLQALILTDLEFSILQMLNLTIFNRLSFLTSLGFVTIFFILLLLFKVFKMNEINILETYFIRNKRLDKINRKILNIVKKLIKN